MWAQPWAWLGLAGLAVPIAIHLLARHVAVRAAFPTLKFIDASQLTAIKRRRLTDIPLLLVRLLMIALAVVAIAGPCFGSAMAAADDEPARVTVYDMTASAATGRSDTFVEGPRLRRATVRADSLREGLEAASAWAERQSGLREITVVSDFQRGAIDDAAVRLVAPGIGLHFERVRSTPPAIPAGFTRDGDRVRMTWPAVTMPAPAIKALAGPDQRDADAMLAAATLIAPSPARAPGVSVVFPKAAGREALLKSLRPIDQPWMFRAIEGVLRNPSLARHVVSGAEDRDLLVFCDASPASLEAAEIVASVSAGLERIDPLNESDTRAIDDAQLKAWERTSVSAAVVRTGEPQGRWLWMAVVGLLAIETLMRRRAA